MTTSINTTNPVKQLIRDEYQQNFLSFCTYVCLVKNKKLNLANIFLLLLSEPDMRHVFKIICDIDDDYTALRRFLEYDPTLYRSKYIKNYIDMCNDIDKSILKN